MASDNQQLRSIALANATYYTASMSPYLQGTEIVQFFQLLNYTNLKIRANTSPVIALSGSAQNYRSTGGNFQAYNDTYAPENMGTLVTRVVDAYTLGRDASLGATGNTQYITFVTSGTQGFVQSGSIRSAANLTTNNRFDTYISHYAEQRDLGMVSTYDDGLPFVEPDNVENPVVIVSTDPEKLVIPTNLVQVCSSPASFDGVIEAMTIRSLADRTLIELPFVFRSTKGSLALSDDKHRSYQFSDTYDLRQVSSGKTVAPYLDSVGYFGGTQVLIDQPGPFSDAIENLAAFTDDSRLESLFPSGSIDTAMRAMFLSGVTSSSVQHFTPDIAQFPSYLISAGHGFIFSQNDSAVYNSIVFGGLLK